MSKTISKEVNHYPQIDYGLHPAYAPYRSAVGYDDRLIHEEIERADRANAEYCAKQEPTEEDALATLSEIQAALERILVHAKSRNVSVVAEEWLHASAAWTLADFRYEFVRRAFAAREYRHHASLPAQHREQLSQIRDRGMYVAPLASEDYDRIRTLAMQHRDELRMRVMQNPRDRAVIIVGFNTPLWNAIKRAVVRAGVIEVLGEFKGNTMTMLGAGLEYSCPEQTWYENLYSDVGIRGGPLQYLHVDEGYCLPKSMIYVTPVDRENGPTCAIPGSNRWQLSECAVRMHRALDRVAGDRYSRFCKNGSYRTIARYPELRRVFMELPAPFRGSSHFGDDILANTDIATALLALEQPYLSERNETFVFDGPHLLHRGSLVRSGERMALQVVYRNRNEERIRARIAKESFVKEQLALGRKYARRIVMEYG